MRIISEFLVVCFYQILYMTIIATVIGIAILLLKKKIGMKLSPNANYVIWMVFLVALLFPISIPSRISIYNFIDIEDVKQENNSEAEYMLSLWGKESNNQYISKEKISTWISNKDKSFKDYFELIIAFSWFTVFLFHFAKRVIFQIELAKNVGDEEVKDERVIAIFNRCKARLQIKRNIHLIRQFGFQMPSTMGIFKVKVLVTDEFLEWDDSVINAVIMHELSHYKRKDNVVNFILLILKSVYWFNPIFTKMFKKIREEMEFAADEMAIANMDMNGQSDYCKVMLLIASTNIEENTALTLGVSTTYKTLGKRIEMIFLKDFFEKNSKLIAISTFLIMVLMCCLFYPTSYARFRVPKLYLQLENGEKIEVMRFENKESDSINQVKLTQNSEVKLVVKDGKSNNYIFYDKIDLNSMQMSEKVANITSGKITYFESGEFIYNFILTYGNNQNMNYAIKIIVE